MQVEHKIQSGVGPKAMELAQVPKVLLLLRHVWAPEAFCVSVTVCVYPSIEIISTKRNRYRHQYTIEEG
jgi:hypothetical protein